MKDRLLSFIRLPLCLAALGLAFALPLAGCSGKSSAPDSSAGAGAGMQGGAGSGPAGATGGSPTAGRRRMARILASLNLSDDQKQQVLSFRRAMTKQNANADPDTKRANYRAFIAKIESILTPEQRTEFEAKTARMRSGGNGQTAASQS